MNRKLQVFFIRIDNVTIGAGSVVTKDIPDSVIAVGNPCRVVREI